MIFVRLIGGLGNQLFQYATGRHLAEIHRTGLKLDISGFETYKLHKYSLGAFNILEAFATPEEVQALTAPEHSFLSRVLGRKPKPARTHIRERSLLFNSGILALPDGVYLDGYWQSESYFTAIAPSLRQEIVVKTPQLGRDREVAELIASSEAVSLHVRRGDYVNNPKTNQIHGTCGLDYYNRCVEFLAGRLSAPHFFIFSDDSPWVRKNLKIPFSATFVDHNGPDSNFEDLRLMSQCSHHILANSSFSWWGAWLNPSPEKIVCAPRRWFQAEKHDDSTLVPTTWHRI